jgi:ceramide glucosyltransferase
MGPSYVLAVWPMTTLTRDIAAILFVAALCSIGYCVFALVRVALFRLPRKPDGSFTPPLTILKPVCGLEPRLYERLRSFCEQDYPGYQVVFGVRYAEDPAVPVVHRLLRELPHADLALVVDDRLYGRNYKLSNLSNMVAAARHDILVVADSDGHVEPDYLRSVVGPFADPAVGAVTCLYVGQPIGGFASDVGAAFMNDWFLPSVLTALTIDDLHFCFGATMAVRRGVLREIGGFEGLAPYLADDYLLGRRVSDRGHAVRLASVKVVTEVFEPNLATLFRHELRWARTFRIVRPIGWPLTFVTDTTVLALLFLLASGGSSLGWSLFGAAVVLRLALRELVRRRFGINGPDRLWLVPVRDLLSFAVRVMSFFGRGIEWRGERLEVLSSGRLETRGERQA